ncbi:hypothetical protein chiPu_0023900, partial [Chiloscyllium punctatum]|nr:hypothetical protein [Chiloscyllium punctatum]
SGISLEDSEKLTSLSNNVEDHQHLPTKQPPLQSVTDENSVKAETPAELKGEADIKALTKEEGTLIVEDKGEAIETSPISSKQSGSKSSPAVKTHEDDKPLEISTLSEKKADPDLTPSMLQQDNQTPKVNSVVSQEGKALVSTVKLDQNQSKLQSSETSENKKPEAVDSLESKIPESSKKEQVLKSTEEMEAIAEGLKRKSTSEEESLLSPEKRPRIVDHQLFRTPPKDFPKDKDEPRELKVPPLKVLDILLLT